MSRLKEREIWKMHPIYTNYEVSDRGRVRRRTTIKNTWEGKILKPLHSRGYLHIQICKDGKKIFKSIHCLVLETFVGPRPEGYQCNHKHEDGDKTRNILSNLEWVTPKRNTEHAWENGFQTSHKGEECWNSKLKEEDIKKIRSLLLEGVSNKEIAGLFNVCPQFISQVKHKKVWKHLKEEVNDQ